MTWLSRARRAARWTRQEWQLLGEAWLALAGAWLAIRRWPMPEVLARLQGAGRQGAGPIIAAPVTRAVQRAAHLYPVPMLCLPQSIALAWMLARRGQPCTLVIGARPQKGELAAHAWIEQAGTPLNSPPDSAETHPVFLRQAIHG